MFQFTYLFLSVYYGVLYYGILLSEEQDHSVGVFFFFYNFVFKKI